MLEAAGSTGEIYGDRLAAELSRLSEAVEDLRRRPVPLDADMLRHIVTASLAEATAPPPNLLVTAIRRLDRLDARLESIEMALGAPPALPKAGGGPRGRGGSVASSVASVSYSAPQLDAEAIADVLARRLAGVLSGSPAAGPLGGSGATIADLVAAVRPLVPGAARNVLRRAGHEPTAQAVEVLQQAALAALDEAAESMGAFVGRLPLESTRPEFAPKRALSSPPLPPPAAPVPPPLQLDVEALAATLAIRVTASVAASVARQLGSPETPAPVLGALSDPIEPVAPFDAGAIAEAIAAHLAEKPPPQAVISPLAMVPLLSAVGNLEAALAGMSLPDAHADADVVGAVGRLESGIDALARALEEDRNALAAEVRGGFSTLTEVVSEVLAGAPSRFGPVVPDEGGVAAEELVEDGNVAAALSGLHRRLDQVGRQLAPLAGADLVSSLPELQSQGRRLERSVGAVLTALAALADHIQDQNLARRVVADGPTVVAGPDVPRLPGDLAELASRLNELLAGTAADRHRLQRVGGAIEGVAEMLGLVSERLDHLSRSEPRTRTRPAAGRDGAPTMPSATADGIGPARRRRRIQDRQGRR